MKQGYTRKTISENIAALVNDGMAQKQAVAAAFNTARKVFRARNKGKRLPEYLRVDNPDKLTVKRSKAQQAATRKLVKLNKAGANTSWVIAVRSGKQTGYYTGEGFDTLSRKARKYATHRAAKTALDKLADQIPSPWVVSLEPNPVRPKGRPLNSRKANPQKNKRLLKAAKLYEQFTGHKPTSIREVKTPNAAEGFIIGTLDGVLYTTRRDGKIEHYKHDFNSRSRPLLVSSYDGKNLYIVKGRYKFTDRGIVDNG